MTDVTIRDEDADIAARRGDWVQRRLTGYGGRTAATQLVSRPDRPSRVQAALPAPEGRSLIARGNGQSPGDAALNDGGAVLLTGRLDRMLAFDPVGGILEAEAGVTVGDVLRTFLPRGHRLAVCPAGDDVTLGGAVACDLHGANHMRAGSFGDHVAWLDLATPSDGLRRISRQDDPHLFEATVGGMGLTGVIVRVAVGLVPVASACVAVHRQAAGSLEAVVEQLREAGGAHDYASANVHALAGGAADGRGVIETGDIAPAPARPWRPMHRPRRQRFGAVAGIAAWPAVSRALEERRYRHAKAGSAPRLVGIDRFLLRPGGIAPRPGDSGNAGALSFECLLPLDGMAAALRRLFDILRRAGDVPRATVLAMGRQGRGMLAFGMPGLQATFELPAGLATADLMHRLEREVLDRGGRICLASDLHLTDHGFAAMYPRLDEFRAVLTRIDPDMRLQSDLARRLRLRDYAV